MSATNQALHFREITSASDPAWPRWKELYLDSFPVDEQMSEGYFLNVLQGKESGENTRQHLLIAEESIPQNGAVREIIGISFHEIYDPLNLALLWYMAIAPQRRNGGIGARYYADLLTTLRASNVRLLAFEVERPEAAGDMAARRLAWYCRQGARRLEGVRYFQQVDMVDEPREMLLMVHLLAPMEVAEVFAACQAYFGAMLERVGPLALAASYDPPSGGSAAATG